MRRWIVCQIGAREHYAIPRALHRAGMLDAFITDVWVPPQSLLARLPGQLGQRLCGRFETDLASAHVRHFRGGAVQAELERRLIRNNWHAIERRNAWFQRRAAAEIKALADQRATASLRHVVFAYSYAARKILREARALGCRTVLGQIDGGPRDARRIAAITAANERDRSEVERASARYWQDWHEECRLADCIVANSDWSRQLILDEGIAPEKVVVVPLMHETTVNSEGFNRVYPQAFSNARPMRVLFLGTLSARKGVREALETVRLMEQEPVEFRFIGRDAEGIGSEAQSMPRVRWEREVPRSAVGALYQWADVFLFPTHSDGFGITQLEAQSWGVPVVASRSCGDVVVDGVSGIRLPDVSAASIAGALRGLLSAPQTLQEMSRQACTRSRSFHANAVLPRLLACGEAG